MSIRSNMTAIYSTVLRRWALVWCLGTASVSAGSAPLARPSTPMAQRAHVVTVEHAFLGIGHGTVPGAAVRAFQDSEPEAGGMERFDVRWYANPPGLPPGTVILLEAVQAHSPTIYNRVLSIPERAEGHMLSILEIPADQIQRAGRVHRWRVSVVWRGRILAQHASANWNG